MVVLVWDCRNTGGYLEHWDPRQKGRKGNCTLSYYRDENTHSACLPIISLYSIKLYEEKVIKMPHI